MSRSAWLLSGAATALLVGVTALLGWNAPARVAQLRAVEAEFIDDCIRAGHAEHTCAVAWDASSSLRRRHGWNRLP